MMTAVIAVMMKKICTAFDKSKPLYSVVYDIETKDVEFLPIFQPHLKTKAKTAFDNISKIEQYIKDGCFINNMSDHLRMMNLPMAKCHSYEYDRNLIIKQDNVKSLKKELCKQLLSIDTNNKKWMKAKAGASIVYSNLEKTGVHNGYKRCYPSYDMKTASGRSRAFGFNIQGTNALDPIRHINSKLDYFVHFDWVSADFRMASILSNDSNSKEIFDTSDPYTYLANLLSNDEFDISRDECKTEILASIYSLDFDNPILDIFPDLKIWIEQKVYEFKTGKYSTLLGMPINKTNLKTSFNAVVQGSVAEAIQSTLYKFSLINPGCILTETHDALIICSDRDNLEKLISLGRKIMVRPFSGFLKDDIVMPIEISIGKKWKQWKKYRLYRD